MENTTKQDMHINVVKNGIGNVKEELRKQSAGANGAGQDFDLLGASATATDKQTWYALNLNNNNAFVALGSNRERQCDAPDATNKKIWSCELCKSLVAVGLVGGGVSMVSDGSGDGGASAGAGEYSKLVGVKEIVSLTVPDKGGGGGIAVGAGEAAALYTLQNGSSASPPEPIICQHLACLSSSKQLHTQISPELSTGCLTAAFNCALAGAAASLTPPANSNSNRTSINNSTDNLSYSSDNYYPDELIVLQNTISADDDDIEIDDDEAEKISLYSDDCVYAYRGDGADYDLRLETMHNRGHFVDDETDFLEMDFEPDPLSEVECGSTEVANSFLMQRDNCISLAPTSNAAHVQRQLYNSPIENLPPLPKGGLQTQSSLLSKNFSRIALHLDQIKSEESPTPDGTRRESISIAATVIETVIEPAEPQSHSLPNSLLATFGRDLQEKQQEERTSPSKVTGAKPKRFNTFSTSSSTSSKISSKSRTSVRSIAFNSTGLCSSNSFDERSVSCTDFRCNPTDDIITNSAAAVAAIAFNDETCLDCLEKEFLANTIGKAMDLSECPKCQKRRAFNAAAYGENLCQTQLKSTSLCYDFNDQPNSDGLFQAKEFIQFNHRNEKRYKNLADKLNEANVATQRLKVDHDDKSNLFMGCNVANQRSTCDILNEKQLLKSVLTEKEIVTISTNNMNEDALVQALDKLKIPYNAELIKTHFKHECDAHNTFKELKSFKQFILNASKQNCNHPRLQRLIEMVTRGQVEVSYKKDTHITQTEMVQLKVADVLHQWTRTNNLELLQQLDKRFLEANVLGKIANIIRQAQQRCSPRRPLPEFISIPQYYASGYLKLTKKC